MKISTGTLVKTIASLGLTILFLWIAFATVDLHAVLGALTLADPSGLLLGVGIVFLGTFPRAWRWGLLMRQVATPAFGRIFGAILAGYAANSFVPRSGEVARVLALREPGATTGLLATVLVERILDLLTLLILFAIVLQIIPGRIRLVYPWLEAVLLTGSVITVLAVGGILMLAGAGQRAAGGVNRFFSRFSIRGGERLSDLVASFAVGLTSVRGPGGYARVAIHTIVLNACYALSVYFPFSSFGFGERYGLGLGDAVVVMAIATLGIVLPTPGGAGTYHVFCSQALTRLYGVPPEESLAFATALHAGVFLVFLLTGGPILISLLWQRRHRDTPSA